MFSQFGKKSFSLRISFEKKLTIALGPVSTGARLEILRFNRNMEYDELCAY